MPGPSPDDPRAPLSRVEFISLLAMLTATIAISIDAMLPAIPDIGSELSPEDTNQAQLVVAAFLVGLGLGTFFTGPLSDAYGRRRVTVAGSVLFILASFWGVLSGSLEALLLARFFQGLGAAGPRVAAMAIIRDLYSGRQMAQTISYVVFVFNLVPILAPSLGWLVAYLFGWRAIFVLFAVFSVISVIWLLGRQPETLLEENRRPFRIGKLIEGTKAVFSNRHVVLAMMAQALIFSALFATLMTSQQVFDVALGRGDTFPLWFGLMGLLAAGGNLINAQLVVRLGMRRVALNALLAQACVTLLFLLIQLTGALEGNAFFAAAFIWFCSVFFLASFGIGNMSALALEPMGKMAGLAASIVTAIATILSVLVAVPIGQAFDGTMVPVTLGVLAVVFLAILLVTKIEEPEDEL